jgi:hypothetical protein
MRKFVYPKHHRPYVSPDISTIHFVHLNSALQLESIDDREEESSENTRLRNQDSSFMHVDRCVNDMDIRAMYFARVLSTHTHSPRYEVLVSSCRHS